MIISAVPIIIVDIIGSMLMIFLAFICLRQVAILKVQDSTNVIWTYLYWVCFALAGFAISRSAGHLLKQVLLIAEYQHVWNSIRPWSGSINTLMFMAVGSVTLYFERTWKIYEQISSDQQALESAHNELIFLNQNLEKLVSERTKALAASIYKYQRLFEVSNDMILASLKDGAILDINPAGLKILGFDKSETISEGKKFQSFFENPRDWQHLKKKIENHGFTSNHEITLKCRGGSTKRTLVTSVLEKGGNSSNDIIHFLVKDIEQRKMMEQQLIQADKLASIGELSSGIAHEINNPLGIILGYTQLLLRTEDPESEKYHDLKIIEKHVQTCKSIVEDLLIFARSSKPSQDVIKLNKVLEDVALFIQHHSKLEKTEIIRDYDQNLPPMLLDEKKIRQVIMNLIMNATHAIGEKGTIGISTRYYPDNNQVAIEVRDTGHGIEQKNLARIFDPFFTTKPTGEGTGLGLSVSYGIIKNHGGNIFVKSEPGKGTTFTVILPIHNCDNYYESKRISS
jgi:two-component system, NtrC family, sensor kinase